MRITLKIMMGELRLLFCSPVAWLILIIFAFVAGIDLTDRLDVITGSKEYGFNGLTFVTQGVFTNLLDGVFINLQKGLFFYIPLLTMGLFSREISSGSIKLLLSSPVKIRQIVLGKFLTMMVFGLLMMVVVLLVVITGNITVVNLDNSALLCGMLGLYLLFCTYSAVGIFMSSLTSYQIVAAMSTLALLAALNFLRQVGQQYAIIRSLTYILSMAGRSNQFISGLFNTRDFIYFILVVILFLGLVVIKMKSERDSSRPATRVRRYAGLIAVILFLGYYSSRPALTGYWDMTTSKSRSLNPENVKLLRQMKEPVVVTAYTNLLDQSLYIGLPARRNDDLDFWEPYLRYLPSIKLDYIGYYDSTDNKQIYQANPGRTIAQIARRQAIGWDWAVDLDDFLTPAEIHQKLDLRKEHNHFIRQVKVGDRWTLLRIFNEVNPQPSEAEVMAAFKRLVQGAPRIAFLTGHGERSIDRGWDDQYNNLARKQDFRKALINQGFDVFNLSTGAGEIPTDLACLVIADPGLPFTVEEQEKIRRYIDAGGNLLVTAEPGRQELLNPLIARTGAGFMKGELVQRSKDNAPDYLLTTVTPEAVSLWESLKNMPYKVIVKGGVGIRYEADAPFMVRPMVVTNATDSWNKLGPIDVKRGPVGYEPEKGDEQKEIAVSAALTRPVHGKEQRIFLNGDADLLSNDGLGRPANIMLDRALFKWFSDGAFPVDANIPITEINRSRGNMHDLWIIKMIFLVVIPVILLLSGGVLIFIRKRR